MGILPSVSKPPQAALVPFAVLLCTAATARRNPAAMPLLGFELEEIRRLLELARDEHLAEIRYCDGHRSIRIKAPRAAGTTAPPEHAATIPANAALRQIAAPTVPDDEPEVSSAGVMLTSPMVGIFYRADKPGAPPFIEVGHHIAAGQSIGVIEAMKIFSDVPAERGGTVLAIPAEDGALVQAGAPLVEILPDDGE
ncbi:MAG: acetyl-CoA carboxylase biotin carboxyl carrier protein [Armatimonadetes bacterium]|nr:acetyl-CoA carboxylase biotin carboxyl carrier protein [Armatimonadota bacterium]MDE2205044.1 acetyl-CoA carboxylase biotin carboxyl carrier protein [Armatimonadota bacterium]